MSIKIAGDTVPGLVTATRVGPAVRDLVRRKYVGIEGESEIVGKPGGRQIVVEMTIFGSYSSAGLIALLDRLHTKSGEHGTLEILTTSGQIPRTFANTTYEAFQQDPEFPTVLKDVAGTLDGNFFAIGALVFYQLLVE